MKRKTSQYLLPDKKNNPIDSDYDLYPSHLINRGKIEIGYENLADKLVNEKVVLLDGYIGVDWHEVKHRLSEILKDRGLKTSFYNIATCLKKENDIANITAPFLGSDDPIFGHKTHLELQAYFDESKLSNVALDPNADLNIIYGTGASQSKIAGYLVYFDLPKNELQFRMRANAITNLGFTFPKNHKQMYKHFYFIDWVVLNSEKKRLLPNIDIIVDQQRPNKPTWMDGSVLRKALRDMSHTCFRVRPWFEPGVWGGQWMKKHFKDLNQDVPNYAWSFEMIVPENGLVFESDGILLEVSFDMLMFQEYENILGKAANRFKYEFPIRFDFLDTFDGGNLSLQCHPKPDYIKKEFGENFTQDETYYILDTKANAHVYLGFQEDIDPTKFKTALEYSIKTKEILDVEKYVQKLPAKKHDLFLIPHGTIHCSGIDNLVLEISATPYIFTFKMYDWQRLDLDGNPRPLNIDRAYENLNFNRKGNVVQDTLISKPKMEVSAKDWKKIHLPTHPDHFYDIYRYEFKTQVSIKTLGQCHVLMLVEGTEVELQVNKTHKSFHYAETFAIPAAVKTYTIINKGSEKAKIIVSFVKDRAC
ncbi:class I mannose-6-phosphate isomerase [Aestuariivivens marinum]|uniref:class I mannose-6-phosphate isomerase n=1 Tax=Aestuariivivens marinum TaxID=2913555 RepID=UPI001F56FE60|nr:class I mannose-6-phosphate isomerase [Aestuariivivens marinum]